MTKNYRRSTPLPDLLAIRRRNLVKYWDAIAICDRLGGVPGDLVRSAKVRVTELLQTARTSDLSLAERITAEFDALWHPEL